MPYGKKIRELRIKRGLTQSELANGIVTPSMISLIESGRANPSEKVLQALAERLGVRFDEIVRGELSVWEESSIYWLVNSLMYSHQLEKAKELIRSFIPETERVQREYNLILSELHIREENFEEARRLLEDLEEKAASDSECLLKVWRKLGRLYLELGRNELGHHYFTKALQLCKNDPSIPLFEKWECAVEVCRFYAEEQRFEEMASLWAEVQNMWGVPVSLNDLAASFLNCALEAQQEKRFQFATYLAHRAYTLLRSVDLLKGLGLLHLYQETLQDPSREVKWITGTFPELLLKAHKHMNSDNQETAIDCVHQALAQAQTDREKSIALQTLSLIQERAGQYLEAADTIRSLIDLWQKRNSPEQVSKYYSRLTQLLLLAANGLQDDEE